MDHIILITSILIGVSSTLLADNLKKGVAIALIINNFNIILLTILETLLSLKQGG